MESIEVMLYMTSNARHDGTPHAHNSWRVPVVNTAVKGLIFDAPLVFTGGLKITVVIVIVMFVCVSSGHDTYIYQLFMDKDDRVLLPTTQQLLELSFMQSDVKLSEVCFFLAILPSDHKLIKI